MIAAFSATAVGLYMLLFARRFYLKQNVNKAIGGEVSVQKALWLAYAVGSWFLVPFIFVFSDMHPIFMPIFLFHLASWWIRAPIELVMIYKTFNWTPIYGISHDLFHGAVILFLYFKMWPQTWDASLSNPMSTLATLYLAVTLFALVMEVIFAYLFRRTRGTGEGAHLIYFASTDPIYNLINRITLVTVVVVYSHFVVQLAWLWWLALRD